MISKLQLDDVEDKYVKGIYVVAGKKGKMPARMRRMHPAAKAAFVKMQTTSPGVVVSDMFRAPESSLLAIQEGRGALMPGYSGHSLGVSIDLAIEATMKELGIKNKVNLDGFMREYGFLCHRTDSKVAFEAWHYDYDLDGLMTKLWKTGETTRAPARERMLTKAFGANWKLTNEDVQTCLRSLGLYSGAIDGVLGKFSKMAIETFMGTWKIDSKKHDYKRILWFVAANKELLPVLV